MNTSARPFRLLLAGTAFLSLLILSEPFSDKVIIRVPLSLLLASPVYFTVIRLIKSRGSLKVRTELRSLIESLYTATASGKTFTGAVNGSVKDLSILYGDDSQIVRAARAYLHSAKLGVSFPERLRDFGGSIDCPEAGPIFDMLSATDTVGNNITYVLQQNAEMLTDMITSARDISSELSQKRTEAVIMSMMPFAVTWNLYMCFPGYFTPVFSCIWAQFVFILVYSISVISVAVCLKFNAEMNSTFDSANRKSRTILLSMAARKVVISRNIFLSKLKELAQLTALNVKARYFRARMKEYRQINYGEINNDIEYWVIKFLLIIVILFLFTLSLISGISPLGCLMSAALLYFAHDNEIRLKAAELRRYRELDYPAFISLLETLISCGVNIPDAIAKCDEIYSDMTSPVSAEISSLSKAVTSGRSVSKTLEDFAVRIDSPEISAVFLGLSGYQITGNPDTLSVIRLHRLACWNKARSAARRQTEIAGSKLILPMLLQFVCISAVSVLPSLISSGII